MVFSANTIGQFSRNNQGQEQVTLNSRSSSGGTDNFTPTTVTRARRLPMTSEDLEQVGAQMGETWVRWRLWGVVAKLGDQIVDGAGVKYAVRKPDLRALRSRSECLCLQEVS